MKNLRSLAQLNEALGDSISSRLGVKIFKTISWFIDVFCYDPIYNQKQAMYLKSLEMGHGIHGGKDRWGWLRSSKSKSE